MQAIAFYFRRFLFFLGDTLFLPWRFLRDLWRDSGRGRTLLFGLPSIIVFVTSILLAILAAGSRSGLQRRYQAAITEAIDQDNKAAAITYTYKLMQLEPGNEKVKFELALMLNKDDSEITGPQNRQRARALFNALAPDDSAGLPEAHIMKAQQIWKDGSIGPNDKVKRMEKQLDLALLGDPENENALSLRAEILLLQRKAEPALEILLKLYKNNVALYRKIAEVYTMLGRASESKPVIEDAIDRYDKLIEAEPANLVYIRRRANAYVLLGEYDIAIDQLRQAIAGETDNSARKEIERALAMIYISRAGTQATADVAASAAGRQAFLEDLTEAYRLDPDSELAMTMLTDFSQRDYPESNQARSVYDARLDPENAPDAVLQQIGTYELLSGNVAQGISFLELGLQRNPRNHEIMNNLAYALIDANRQRALELANVAIRMQKTVPNYFDTRANIYMRMGDVTNAIRDFERAMSLASRILEDNSKEQAELDRTRRFLIQVYGNLVVCYQQVGMMEEAGKFQAKADELKNRK